MIKKIKAIPVVAALLWGVGTHAQGISPSTLNAAGGSTEIAGDAYEYSIGEMVLVSTFSGPDLIVTQGLLQPFGNGEVGIEALTLSDRELSAYPNPSSDIVYIQPNLSGGGRLTIVLTDITGRQVSTKTAHLKHGNEKQNISLNSFASGSYMLRVTFTAGKKSYVRNFKIQKTN